ncbi:tetratricopeptide repeat protein [uncultured Acetobacteroides sp.]|uniref:tetratricopeptide repeat protein n=1 Tax=uncultured Acetobacteroides sp. TaxID=1760811 RepID=UPI0029F47B8F|nr:tetratricopeptide repeat protein [uncultured Acetobacteroides sp.]
MEILKRFFPVCLLALALNVQAQTSNLIDAFSKSYSLEASKKYDDAISVLNKAYDASSYETNLRLGWLHYLAGKQKESVAFYEKASNLMPSATEPLWAVLKPLTALKQWDDCEKNYMKIIKLDPKNSVANYQLGMIYYNRKNYLNAKQYFDVSLILFPFDYDNMLMSAWTCLRLERNTDAKSLFNKVLLYRPNDASALDGLKQIK